MIISISPSPSSALRPIKRRLCDPKETVPVVVLVEEDSSAKIANLVSLLENDRGDQIFLGDASSSAGQVFVLRARSAQMDLRHAVIESRPRHDYPGAGAPGFAVGKRAGRRQRR